MNPKHFTEMKNLTIWFAIAALLFALYPTQLTADSNSNLSEIGMAGAGLEMMAPAEASNLLLVIPGAEMAMVTSAASTETAHANSLEERLNQISEMDMSVMSASEKNELRKEVRSIQKEQRPSGGIYVSVGAAILIVLLLILLL